MDGSGETTWSDERHANGKPTLHRIPDWNTHKAHGFKRGKLERCLLVYGSNETRGGISCRHPLICAKPATLEKFWMQITKMVVTMRREALNHRVRVVYLGFGCRSVHDGDRRRFTVEPAAKYVDECLDIVQQGSDDAFDATEELESTR